MRIGIDFDDVLADSMQVIIDLHNKRYGTSYKHEDATSFHLEEIWGGTKEEWKLKLEEFLSTRHLVSLNPMAGVIPAIDALKKEGHELYILTGRSDAEIVSAEQWIEKHFPDTFKNIHYEKKFSSKDGNNSKKFEVCKEIGVEIMIEDSMNSAKECAEAGIRVFLFDQPWNRGDLPFNMTRVKSWDEIVQRLH